MEAIMGDERTLLIGIDLGEEYTQVSNFQKKSMQPEPVSFSENKEEYFIPTCLCLKEQSKEWLIGQEALLCAKREQGVLVRGLLQKLSTDEEVTLYGQGFPAVTLLEKYLRKIFSELRRIYQNNNIKKLVITTKDLNEKRRQQILEALKRLGLEEDRVLVLSRIQCFMYYTVSQKQELWLNDVGLFDYNEPGLRYYQLSFCRKKLPIAVVVNEINLTETMSLELRKKEEPERLCYRFEDIAKQILYKKTVSTLYVTGIGFEGNYADQALKNLCAGRRVFKGQNLYTKGACYAANALDSGLNESYLLLGEEAVTSEIGIMVYQDAKEQEYTLSKPGTAWWEVNHEINVILDNTEELHFVVSSIINNESLHEIMKLDGLTKRENKTIRLSIQLHFVDRETAVVTVRDKGFGIFYDKNHRIWEQILKL